MISNFQASTLFYHRNTSRSPIFASLINLNRAVFKWLSKVITWFRLLRLVIGLTDLHQLFNQWEAKPKAIAPCTRDFSRALSELQVIARNCDWLIALSAPVLIGRSICCGFGFSTVIWKTLYPPKRHLVLYRGLISLWDFSGWIGYLCLRIKYKFVVSQSRCELM